MRTKCKCAVCLFITITSALESNYPLQRRHNGDDVEDVPEYYGYLHPVFTRSPTSLEIKLGNNSGIGKDDIKTESPWWVFSTIIIRTVSIGTTRIIRLKIGNI